MIFVVDVKELNEVENIENFIIFNFNSLLETGINCHSLYDISNKLSNLELYGDIQFDREYANAIMNNVDDFKIFFTIMYYQLNGANVIILIDNLYDEGYTIEALTKLIKERYGITCIYDSNTKQYLYSNNEIYDTSINGIYNANLDMTRFMGLMPEKYIDFISKDVDTVIYGGYHE